MAQVFISYRQINHAQRSRVRAMAERIRNCGVEVIFDQFYKEQTPGASDDGWTIWSENHAEEAEKVLVIASAEWFQCYLKKAPPGTGLGAAAEAHILHSRITKAGTRAKGIRIVVLDDEGKTSIPLRLEDFPHFDLRQPDSFEEMIAWIGGVTANLDKEVTAETASIPARLSAGWVWSSSVASHKAGLKSVLACLEALLAVCAYWWVAWRFDTHVHLVTSVLIAPLLLLRSPQSIAAGVRWFMKDWFGFENYEVWAKGRKRLWLGLSAVFAGSATFVFAHGLSTNLLAGLDGWPVFYWSTMIGALLVVVAVALAFTFAFGLAGVSAGVGGFAGAVEIAGLGAGALVGVLGAWQSEASLAGLFTGAILGSTPGFFGGSMAGVGIGYTSRALLIRVLATLTHLHSGFARLPNNWQETLLHTDSRLPAELLPGIRDLRPNLALDGFWEFWKQERRGWQILRGIYFPFLFLPPLLYRLNLKATAWFWWPLALLLEPPKARDGESDEMEVMCSPWTNPVTMVWTLFSVVLGAGPVVIQFLDLRVMHGWRRDDPSRVVPASWETFLSIRWEELAPWNWLQLLSAVAGGGILYMAGSALSHKRNGNWGVYRRSWNWNHGLMTLLRRLNFFASMAVMSLAFGALLLHTQPVRAKLPKNVVEALDAFYSRHPHSDKNMP